MQVIVTCEIDLLGIPKKVTLFNRFILILALVSYNCTAQNLELVYHQYGVNEGLPSSEVYDVEQDPEGYMWFCTDRGVSRFDGFEFQNFTSEDGLSDDVILRMQFDEYNRLWFIGYNGTLSYLEDDIIQPFEGNEKLKEVAGQLIYRGIRFVSKDHFYLESFSSTLLEYKDGGVRDVKETPNFHGYGLGIDRSLGTSDPVFFSYVKKFPDAPVRICMTGLEGDSTSFSLSNLGLNRWSNTELIAVEGDWLVNFDGTVCLFNERGMIDMKTFNHNIISTYYDGQKLWIGLLEGGMITLSVKNGRLLDERHFLGTHSVSRVFRDRSEGLWFTTTDAGVFYCINDGIEEIRTGQFTPHFLDGNDNDLYAMSLEGVLYRFNYDQRQFYPIRDVRKTNKPSRVYSSLTLGEDGKLYLGKTASELLVLDALKNEKLVQISPEFFPVYRICFIDTGVLLSHYRFVSQLNSDMEVIFHSGLIDRVFDVTAYNGEIYAGGQDGIYRLNGKDFVHCFSSKRIQEFQESKYGLLAATRGDGLFLFNEDTVKITHEQGLVNDWLNNIDSRDGKTFWLSSKKGVSSITFDDNNDYRLKSYTVTDGLLSNEIDYVVDGRKYLAMRSAGKVFIAQKDRLVKQREAVLHIEDFRVGDRSLLTEESIQLGHRENSVVIELTTICYSCLGNKNVRYELNGELFHTEQNEINLNSLSPGEYYVRIFLCNGTGEWIEADRSFDWVILPPFWKTPWFVSGGTFLSVVLVFFIFGQIRGRIRKRNEERELLEHFQQKALLLQMNPHFIYNSLNSIQSKVLSGEKLEAHRFIAKFGMLIRKNLEFSDLDLINIDTEIELLDIYLGLEARRLKKALNWRFDVDEGIDPKICRLPPFLLQPIVENAIWHGINQDEEGDGIIAVRIRAHYDQLIIEVCDNGVGVLKSTEKHHNRHKSKGSKILQKRMSLLESTYKVETTYSIQDLSEEGGRGTRVTLKLPLIK